MKRFTVFATLLTLFAITISTHAQFSETCTIESDRSEGVRAITFTQLTDSVMLVDANIILNCESTTESLRLIDPAPAVNFGEPAPRPINPAGLPREQSGYAIVNVYAANLRAGDGSVYTRVGIVRAGDELVVLGRNEAESWWYVQADDTRGWINDELLVLRGDLTNVPIVETIAERTPPTAYVGFTGNLIYDTFQLEGQSICPIQGRTEYLLIGRSRTTSWLLIEATCLDGTPVTGWLPASAALIRNTGLVPVPIYER